MGQSIQSIGGVRMKLEQNEKELLRSLARRLAEIAARPEQAAKRRLWEKHNTLRGERPMFLCDQLPWNELDPACVYENSTIKNGYWAFQEVNLRREIYKAEHLLTDAVVDPYVKLSLPYDNSGWGLQYHITQKKLDPNGSVASQHMECLINDFEDVEKIQLPVITPQEEKVKEVSEQADELFDGIIPWKFTGCVLHLGVWDFISYWMGVENCYIELMDRPELMHAVMERCVQGLLSQIKGLNKYKLYDTNEHYCHCSHTYMPGDDPDAEGLTTNGWAFGLAQLFTSVSPAITEEFECAYMQRVFPHFKNIYYGCCDRLDDRLDKVSRLPNVRKISCSPWSKREAFAEKLPASIIMGNKPSPAMLADDTFDEELVRRDLRRTIDCAAANGKTLEMILKDVSTVRYDPARLARFCEIAREETER